MIQSVFNRALIAAAAISTLVLSGCSSVPLDESVKAGTTRAEADAAAGAGRDAAAAALQQKSIYFDFDSYSVKPVYLPVIEAHARNLISNSAMHIVIEGNTDSRGSREYNLALGQRLVASPHGWKHLLFSLLHVSKRLTQDARSSRSRRPTRWNRCQKA